MGVRGNVNDGSGGNASDAEQWGVECFLLHKIERYIIIVHLEKLDYYLNYASFETLFCL